MCIIQELLSKFTGILLGIQKNYLHEDNDEISNCKAAMKSDKNRMGSVSSKGKFAMSPIKDLVDEFIASDTVVIFSKSYCPYCTKAKKVFDKLKQAYKVIELDERDDGDEIQSILGEMTGAKTVPRVFVKGECLGGGTDIEKLYNSGELAKKF